MKAGRWWDPGNGAQGQRTRVVLTFALAVVPPLVLLAYLSLLASQNQRAALEKIEESRAREVARLTVDALGRAFAQAEDASFPKDLSPLRSYDPAVRAKLERDLALEARAHPLVLRYFALDESGKVLLPDARLPYRTTGASAGRAGDPSPAGRDQADTSSASLALYRKACDVLALGDRTTAILLLDEVARDASAGVTLKLRAGFRKARALEESEPRDLPGATLAYSEVASSPVAARGEDGTPLRPTAALREADLRNEMGEPEGAYLAAAALARSLLEGEQADLSEAEWDSALGQARTLVNAEAAVVGSGSPSSDDPWANPATGPALLSQTEADLRDRLSWVREIEGDELGWPLRQALDNERADEFLTLARLRDPHSIILYKVLPPLSEVPEGESLRAGRLLFGVQLDLDRLASDVLAPVCKEQASREGVTVAVVDAHGQVRARAGSITSVTGTGPIEATLPLEPPPLWQLRIVRTGEVLASEARRGDLRLLALLLLAVVAAAVGGLATLRSVGRSLELARMKQDFVSNVTHELKTPLTSIRMYAETLSLGRARTEEKKKEYLENILRESERLGRLIDDILDFARLGEGKRPFVLAESDVADVTREAIDLFRHSASLRGFELYVDLPAVSALPPVDLDRDAIVRAVLNLLSNAVKYSGDSRYVRVAVAREGDSIGIAVTDRGVGIEPEDLDRIFERFYRAGDSLTREVSGAGLGLTLVDEIVRAHGGRIRVESARGKGSTFTVLLPIVLAYRGIAWPPRVTTADAAPEKAAPQGAALTPAASGEDGAAAKPLPGEAVP